MNILLITDDFFPNKGGIAQHLTSLCKKFRETNHKLYILNSTYTDNKEIFNLIKKKSYTRLNFFLQDHKFYYYLLSFLWKLLTKKKIRWRHRIKLIFYYLFIHTEKLFNQVQNFKNLKNICSKIRFDLILTGSASFPLDIGYILALMYDKKIVTIAHGDDFLVRSKLSFRSSLFRNIDGIITTNEYTKNLFHRIHHIELKKIKIIHLGLILDDYILNKTKEELRKELNIDNDLFVMLSVGRHVPRKKFDLIIKTVGHIIETYKDINIKYFLIGEGPLTNSYKETTNKLNLSDRIIFLGNLNNKERNKFYKLSDIFIMVSKILKHSIEGFGIVFLEANYYNLPCIGSYSGGIVSAIEEGKTGYLINPEDGEKLEEKIITFYNNNQLRIKMGKYAHHRVLENFNWELIIQDYMKYFNKVIAK